MSNAIYSEIPMRTWRWLGVNEARVPENISGELQKRVISVSKGCRDSVVVVYRKEQQGHIQVQVAEGAELHLIKVQLLDGSQPHTDRIEATVAAEGKIKVTAIEAGAAASATELVVDLQGDAAEADVAAIYFGDGQRQLDMNYIIRQQGRHTHAKMQIRGALLDDSRKTFRGTLDFQRGAKGSEGRENEEVVLLSPKVRNRSVPLMLSHEDDVDGHHAVSIGKMDEAKLFYLMSRGLDMAEAQRLVVDASFQPVLDRIPDADLKQEVEEYIKGRLTHEQ